MNDSLRELVLSSSLKDEKRRISYYRDKIFDNGRKMAALTFDRNVGLYALNYDRYLNILYNEDTSNNFDINLLFETMRLLERLDGVKEYIRLRGEIAFLENKINDYFKKVNITFRYDLTDLDLPHIYVFGKDTFTHIIDTRDSITTPNDGATLIYPVYYMNSKRDFRHFYNKLSFHYLESLIDDCDYDISKKKLGKIKIKTL